MPTLTALCDVPAPDNLQGQSLVPMLKDPEHKGRGWALTQVMRGRNDKRTFGYTLRTPQWRYTEWDEGRRGRELYDHDVDPLEQTNLADDPEQADLVAQLSGQLREAVADLAAGLGRNPAALARHLGTQPHRPVTPVGVQL